MQQTTLLERQVVYACHRISVLDLRAASKVLARLCVLVFIGTYFGSLYAVSAQNKAEPADKVRSGLSCDKGPTAIAQIEDIWTVPNGTNARYVWTYCDGVTVKESRMDYEPVNDFEKFLITVKAEGELVDRSGIFDGFNKEIGSTYLFRKINMTEKSWLLIIRKGIKTEIYQSTSYIHMMFLANSRKCEASKQK